MGYDFLLGCVSLCTSVAVCITDCPDMESCLVMITDHMEYEMAINWSNLVIFALEIPPVLDMSKVSEKRITA